MRTATPFLLQWAPEEKEYSAVDVTKFYIQRVPLTVRLPDAEGNPVAGTVRIYEGGRLIAQRHLSTDKSLVGTAVFELAKNAKYEISVTANEIERPRRHLTLNDDENSLTLRLQPGTDSVISLPAYVACTTAERTASTRRRGVRGQAADARASRPSQATAAGRSPRNTPGHTISRVGAAISHDRRAHAEVSDQDLW